MVGLVGLKRIHLIFEEKVVSGCLLFAILYGVQLVNPRPEVVRISSECNLELSEKLVHSAEQGLGRVGQGVH